MRIDYQNAVSITRPAKTWLWATYAAVCLLSHAAALLITVQSYKIWGVCDGYVFLEDGRAAYFSRVIHTHESQPKEVKIDLGVVRYRHAIAVGGKDETYFIDINAWVIAAVMDIPWIIFVYRRQRHARTRKMEREAS